MRNEENLLGGIIPTIQPYSNTPIHSPNDFGLNNQLKYYLAISELKNKISSCFFCDLSLFIENLFCICVSSSLINNKNIESKDEIIIYLGDYYISIKLDLNKRRILHFKNNNDIILIQVYPDIDNITKDKFLKIKNDDLDAYIGEGGKDVYVVGYRNFMRKEISFIKTNIIELQDNFRIKLLEGKSFLSCSPICTINENETQIKNKIKIIGVEGESNILTDSSGFLFAPNIDTLEDYNKSPNILFNNIMNNIISNDYKNNIIDIDINNNLNLDNSNNINNINKFNYNINNSNNNFYNNEVLPFTAGRNNNLDINNNINDNNFININEILPETIGNNNNRVGTNFINQSMKDLQHYYFYTFDEYKQHVIKFHNKISKYYVSQTQSNYNRHYIALEQYLTFFPAFSEINRKFIQSLDFFKNVDNFKKKISDEMINNFNKILSSDNLELIDKFSYFIAGLKLALNVYGSNKISFFFTSYDAFYRENGEKLYKRISLKYEDMQRFKDNEGKIILFKTILDELSNPTVSGIGDISGFINKEINDINFKKSNSHFDTKIYINYKFEDSWTPTCLGFSQGGPAKKIFNLFTFFKVIKVTINNNTKQAEIILENVGIKYNLEEKINEYSDDFSVQYNSIQNIIEIV